MQNGFRLIWSDDVIRRSVLVFAGILILFIILFIIKFRDLPPQLPLFYSLPRGNDQLASPILLAILPICSLIIEIINLIISLSIFAKEKLLARILMITGSFTSLLLFITFIKIIFTVS